VPGVTIWAVICTKLCLGLSSVKNCNCRELPGTNANTLMSANNNTMIQEVYFGSRKTMGAIISNTNKCTFLYINTFHNTAIPDMLVSEIIQ
jgi:Na+-transporting NADH:ubiquinone oxidoreductase subunit NqrF